VKTKFINLATASMAALLLTFATIVAPLSTVYAAANGNNGTLKVHEIGTPSGTASNDPKVCAFNLEGFSFDDQQSGYIMITTQGGSQPVGQDAGPFNFGPTDNSGYAISQDYNTSGGTTIANGTYKATLYGKDTGGQIDLNDEKAKSKVFKVDCQQDTPTTPAIATFNDACGTVNDTYTIPTTIGVKYSVGNISTVAGTYPGSGTIVATVLADNGYVLQGTITWQYTFTDVACPSTEVAPTAPSMYDLTCEKDGSYTIPEKTGITYKVDSIVTAAGTYNVPSAKTIVITAEANQGYILDGQATWTFTFHSPEGCEQTPPSDVCPNIDGVQTQVPDNMQIDQHGNCITPGRGGNDTPPTLDITTVAAPVQTPVVTTSGSATQLVNTGTSALLSIFVGLALFGATAVVTIFGRKDRILTSSRPASSK
jgi:hypothetical protein